MYIYYHCEFNIIVSLCQVKLFLISLVATTQLHFPLAIWTENLEISGRNRNCSKVSKIL